MNSIVNIYILSDNTIILSKNKHLPDYEGYLSTGCTTCIPNPYDITPADPIYNVTPLTIKHHVQYFYTQHPSFALDKVKIGEHVYVNPNHIIRHFQMDIDLKEIGDDNRDNSNE